MSDRFEEALNKRYQDALDCVYDLLDLYPEHGSKLARISATLAEYRGRYEAYRDRTNATSGE